MQTMNHRHEEPQASILLGMDLTVCPESYYYTTTTTLAVGRFAAFFCLFSILDYGDDNC